MITKPLSHSRPGGHRPASDRTPGPGGGKAEAASAPTFGQRAQPNGLTPAREFLDRLVKTQLMGAAAAMAFLQENQRQLAGMQMPEAIGKLLVQANHLSPYQLDRVLAGTTHGLILGNHRVIERLGAGAMGVVFKAEHLLMKRRVAIKVLPMDTDCPAELLERFYAEMRVLADFHHPHIVLAFDAGQLPPAGPGMPALLYLVLELVPGGDLEQYCDRHPGPVAIEMACEWIRQAASGLQEAHDRHLIHRDVKPSNLLLDAQGRIKVVDFGLARQFRSAITDSGSLLGTLEFMAPEQSFDPSNVDGRADIYGLGATLFWLLTGQLPFPPARTLAASLRQLQSARPRRLLELRPEVPAQLDDLVDRMLRRDPSSRPEQPLVVMNELLAISRHLAPANSVSTLELTLPPETPPPNQKAALKAAAPGTGTILNGKRILIVDDEPPIRAMSRLILEPHGCVCGEADCGAKALELLDRDPYDLMLLDLNLPDVDGYEICRQLKVRREHSHFKIIVISGRGDRGFLADSIPIGADDFIPKPYQVRELLARIENVFKIQNAEDQSEHLLEQLQLTNHQLENSLSARTEEARNAQDALLFAMSKMAEAGDGETPGHLRRLQRYTSTLARYSARLEGWTGVVSSVFLEQVERCVPLHDIGKIALPESVLLKPGRLSEDERKLMQTHTLIGFRILEALRLAHGQSLAFLGMASCIVRSHHERFDGKGYPDKLAGQAIPAAARLLAIGDVYDALRRQRFHKQPMTHAEAVQIMLEGSNGQFDPDLLQAFSACHRDFEQIYRDIPT